MKALTWNVNRAGVSRTGLWNFIEREDADIVMLQEVTSIPDRISDRYQSHLVKPRYFGGHVAPFASAVLAKGSINSKPFLESELDWVNRIHSERGGWILECEVAIADREQFRVVSVHSPAFPIPQDQWAGIDVGGVKLANNPDLWFSQILWALLRPANLGSDTNWIVGGDFNSSVLFDYPRDRGNRENIARLKRLGLIDCLSSFKGESVPTFQDSRKNLRHQIDYFYVNEPLLDRLVRACVPNPAAVFGPTPRLSDHLPIICKFGNP